MRRVLIVSVSLTLALSAPILVAQDDSAPPAPVPAGDSGQRALLEQQIQERAGIIVRRQLQLTDEQFAQLQAVNRKYAGQRRTLNTQERYLRLSLRAELALGQQADQSKVGGYLDQLGTVQQQRLEIFRQEQQDLSAFLTPVQRAKYAALEEQIRRRVAVMRQRALERAQSPAPPRLRPLRARIKP